MPKKKRRKTRVCKNPGPERRWIYDGWRTAEEAGVITAAVVIALIKSRATPELAKLHDDLTSRPKRKRKA